MNPQMFTERSRLVNGQAGGGSGRIRTLFRVIAILRAIRVLLTGNDRAGRELTRLVPPVRASRTVGTIHWRGRLYAR